MSMQHVVRNFWRYASGVGVDGVWYSVAVTQKHRSSLKKVFVRSALSRTFIRTQLLVKALTKLIRTGTLLTDT